MKSTGIPLGDFPLQDIPHTISYALLYRMRLNSFQELPKDKQPPRNLWDKPYRLSEFFDDIFKRGDKSDAKTYIDIDDAEME